ncbi:hypothetical protein AB0C02_27050 [Micromonospora sp. NPDC048999]|uniref:hypothetical protein n=1 Tax=Micromonospora sp. NPDC048999 TaxID=3155391 RepID=UPI0033EE2B2A
MNMPSRLLVEGPRTCREAFRRLEAFESVIRQAAALGAQLVQLAAVGLARAALAPRSSQQRGD